MKLRSTAFLLLLPAAIVYQSCNGDSEKTTSATESTTTNDTTVNNTISMETPAVAIKEETVNYSAGNTNMIGFAAYDSSGNAKRPVVMVVPEWWGLNDYTKSRVRQLAALGYFAMAVDMYGNGKTADNPKLAGELSGPFYRDTQMAKSRFDAALAKVASFPGADASKVAAIGYCFGGAQVINFAKMGGDFKGVVSFHGNLVGVPVDKNRLKTPILVCHGEDDQFVKPAEVEQFKKEMDAAGAAYTFKSYKGATHAFSNPGATAVGEKFKIPIAYNAAADSASWNEMKDFFQRIFK